jgi:hypothetical protein
MTKLRLINVLFNFFQSNLWFLVKHKRFMNTIISKMAVEFPHDRNKFENHEIEERKYFETFMKKYELFADVRKIKLKYILQKLNQKRGLKRVVYVLRNRLYISRDRLEKIHAELIYSPYHRGHFYRNLRSEIGVKMMKN